MVDLIGKSVGPYQILDQIGQGGMASVFKAYHPTTDRPVALKILPPQLASDPNFRIRFEREAKIVANLTHIHIVPVFDYGQAGDIAYLVMPYIPTGTLKEYLRAGPLSLKETTRLFLQIASAVYYAHQKGVVHRDIKPANVLLDASNNALLNDFGITRIAEETTDLTGSRIIGTPDYMSPEQGQGHKIDARSDLYSLGIMAYEMLVGEVPFSADTPLAVIFKHVNDPLPPLRMVRPNLPEALDSVLQKSLEKSPDERFQTAKEMAAAWRAAVASNIKVPSKSIHLRVPIDNTITYHDTDEDLATELLPEIQAPPKAKRKRESQKDRPPWPLIILLTIVVGGLFALFAILSSNVDEGTSGNTYLNTPASDNLVEIVIAIQHLPRGMVIPENGIALVLVPANAASSDNYTNPADVIGLTARTDIVRGSFINQHNVYRNVRHLGLPEGTPTLTVKSPFPTPERIVVSSPNSVEFALDLSPQVNLPTGIAPGDLVDIVATTSQQDLSQVSTTIISTVATVTQRSDTQVVLLVTTQESIALSTSMAQGDQITLVGRAAGDTMIKLAPAVIHLDAILQNQTTLTPTTP